MAGPLSQTTRRPAPRTRRPAARAVSRRAGLLRLLLVLAVVAAAVVWSRGRLDPADGCSMTTGAGIRDIPRADAVRLTDLAARDERGRASLEVTTAAVGGDRQLATGLRGLGRGALTCAQQAPDSLSAEAEGPDGLTPRAHAVRAAMAAAFGRQSLGGFASGGVSTGHMPGSAHYDGRAVDVFFRPVGDEQRRQGWVLAQWLVARAERLAVATVIFDDRIWTARRSGDGWRDYTPPQGRTDNPVLRHLDHVHVDVVRGG